MPHFYSHDKTVYGRVRVTPKQWYRRFLINQYSIFPYVTMGNIEFFLELDNLERPTGVSAVKANPRIYSRIGDGTYRQLEQVRSKKFLVKGKAEYTGDTKFFVAVDKLGTNGDLIEQQGILLFSDNVLSINSYVWGWGCGLGGIILSGLCSLLVGILLALVVIRPFWETWIPWKP